MSENNKLHVVASKPQSVLHVPEDMEVDNTSGHMVTDPSGIFAGARLPDAGGMLSKEELDKGERILNAWESYAEHLPRGDEHARVCAKFFGGGLKGACAAAAAAAARAHLPPPLTRVRAHRM